MFILFILSVTKVVKINHFTKYNRFNLLRRHLFMHFFTSYALSKVIVTII